MKVFLLLLFSIQSFAQPVGYVIRSNVTDLQKSEVQIGSILTLPKATETSDFWFTIKYYETCAEETHINSRKNEAVSIEIKKILEGDCRDETTLD